MPFVLFPMADYGDDMWLDASEDMHSVAARLDINAETYRIIQKIRTQAETVKEPCTKVIEVMRRTRLKSLSKEWHHVRGRLLTASDMAAVFGENPYRNQTSVFLGKTRQEASFKGNIATRWGQRYEGEAADVYNMLTNMPLCEDDLGLFVSDYEKEGDPGRKRYAATPDRLAWSGTLLEIKCPFRRKITHDVPLYYRAQLQCQMWVTGCDLLHFVQYKPPTRVANGVFDIVQVERNLDWWPQHQPVLDHFWDRVIAFYTKRELELGELHAGTPQEIIKKETALKMRADEPMYIVQTS